LKGLDLILEIRGRALNRPLIIAMAFALYVAGFVLNSTYLLPHLSQINFWDEVTYIAAGKDFAIHHKLWAYPRGPVIAFIYGLLFTAIHPILEAKEYWLMTVDMAGRIIAYTLLFINAWLIGNELERRNIAPSLVIVALFTALPVYTILLPSPSYWTFTAFVSLSLWLALIYARTQRLPVLIAAGVMVGLALMARPDVVFGVSALVAMLLVTRPWRISRMLTVVVVMAGIPTALVAGYIGLFGLQTGVYLFGGESKLYNTFEASSQVLFDQKETKKKLDFERAADAKIESERAFGTAAENNNSVLRAIVRNPSRFALMIWRNTTQHTVPSLMSAFGIRIPAVGFSELKTPIRNLSIIILFLATLGIVEIIQRREWPMLLIFTLWTVDLGLYLFTISFPGYFLFHFIIVLLLAAVGLWAGLGRLGQSWMLALWAAVLAIVFVLDWAPSGRIPPLAMASAALLALGLWQRQALERYRPLTASIFLMGLLICNLPNTYRFDWPGKDVGYIAQAKYLQENYQSFTPTMAYPGIAPVSANMWWIPPWADVAKIKSKEDFLAAMKLVGMPLIILDPWLTFHNIYGISTSIKKYAANYYRLAWSTPNGQYKILMPKDLSRSKVQLLKR
jgi:hypothetical protein